MYFCVFLACIHVHVYVKLLQKLSIYLLNVLLTLRSSEQVCCLTSVFLLDSYYMLAFAIALDSLRVIGNKIIKFIFAFAP